MAAETTISAQQISELLKVRYEGSGWIIVTQCKNGPSYGAHGMLRILDAFAIRKSWTQPCTAGFEIKVNRGDFKSDYKWRDALPFCNEFWFVCPPGVIDKEELGDGIGLIVTSVGGRKLFTKRKAAYREHEDRDALLDVLLYVLMGRITVTDQWRVDEEPKWTAAEREEYVMKCLEKKEEGWRLGKKLGRVVREKIQGVNSECERLRRENETLRSVKAVFCKMFGDDERQWLSEYYARQRIEESRRLIPKRLASQLVSTRRTIGDLISTLKTRGIEFRE